MKRLLLALLCFWATTADAKTVKANATNPETPKLVVVVVVDQFSAGLFEQYRTRFTHGLRTLSEDGVVFPNGYQSHAATETCPGHSTILSGQHPSETGIIANYWLAGNDPVYCVKDESVAEIGRDKSEYVGPANLKARTLGDWLHGGNPASKVVTVSGKDRAAITLAGKDSTDVYWWDRALGFNTYKPKDDDAEKHAALKINDTIKQSWMTARPAWPAIEPKSNGDGFECPSLNGESFVLSKATRTFNVPPTPAKFKEAVGLAQDKPFFDWFQATPLLDSLTVDFAIKLIDDYRLGTREGVPTDLLAISLSATDYVGHRYGNQGPEMCDQLKHLDIQIGRLLDKVQALKVPYVLALTADHGGIDFAERVQTLGQASARRVELKLAPALNEELKKYPGLVSKPWREPAKIDEQSLYLDGSKLSPKQQRAVIRKTVELLQDHSVGKYPWSGKIYDALPRYLVEAAPDPVGIPADELSISQRLAESYYAERSPDLFVVFKPYSSIGPAADYIAGHGSPWNYDRRVPIIFYGAGLKPFEQYLPIETVDIAPTLAAISNITVPVDSDLDGICRDINRGSRDICR